MKNFGRFLDKAICFRMVRGAELGQMNPNVLPPLRPKLHPCVFLFRGLDRYWAWVKHGNHKIESSNSSLPHWPIPFQKGSGILGHQNSRPQIWAEKGCPNTGSAGSPSHGSGAPGKPKATVCEENEEIYGVEGCAPLECATMPRVNQTGYRLWPGPGTW